MELSQRLSELLAIYRETEGPGHRGPRFKDVALALESEMTTNGVTLKTLIACFGPPDLFGSRDDLVYVFDYEQAGRNRHEWYFYLDGGRLVNSGYNERGINDLSHLTDGSKFPLDDA